MKVVREEPKPLDESYLERLAEEYKKSKELQEQVEKRTNAIKKELSEAVETHGTPDDKGHLWLKVGEASLKRERRVTRSFDTSAAEQWARENNMWDDIKQVIEVVDEDKVLGLAWKDESLAEKVREFYTEKETWAFKA
jgi:hypothetical protein